MWFIERKQAFTGSHKATPLSLLFVKVKNKKGESFTLWKETGDNWDTQHKLKIEEGFIKIAQMGLKI